MYGPMNVKMTILVRMTLNSLGIPILRSKWHKVQSRFN